MLRKRFELDQLEKKRIQIALIFLIISFIRLRYVYVIALKKYTKLKEKI